MIIQLFLFIHAILFDKYFPDKRYPLIRKINPVLFIISRIFH
jgi:hypothetical protein